MKSSFKIDSNRFLKVIGIVLCIVAFCSIISFLFVYPLWYFADKKPTVFSYAILTVFASFVAYRIVNKIRMYLVFENPDKVEKKKRLRRLLKSILFFVIVAFALIGIGYFVLSGNRMFSLIPLVLGMLFCILLQKK